MAPDQPPKRKRAAKKKAPRKKASTRKRSARSGGGGPPARCQAKGQPKPPPADPTDLESLDLQDGRDRAVLRRCISQGWQLHGEDLQRAHGMLREAAGIAESRGDERAMRGCVDLWLRMAAQVQSDEQLDAKLAAGAGMDGMQVTIRVVRED